MLGEAPATETVTFAIGHVYAALGIVLSSLVGVIMWQRKKLDRLEKLIMELAGALPKRSSDE